MDFVQKIQVLNPFFSKVVGCKYAVDSSVDVNSRCGMNFGSNAVLTLNPNLIDLGIVSVNTTDTLGSGSVPTTRFVLPTGRYDGIRHGHDIEEATADRVSETRANSNYILKSDFESMR